jgi:hypothetical protein
MIRESRDLRAARNGIVKGKTGGELEVYEELIDTS